MVVDGLRFGVGFLDAKQGASESWVWVRDNPGRDFSVRQWKTDHTSRWAMGWDGAMRRAPSPCLLFGPLFTSRRRQALAAMEASGGSVDLKVTEAVHA